MRSWFVAASLVFALALAMSGTAGATDAAATAAEKDARFFLAVCQNALDDLAAVSRLAAEQNWSPCGSQRLMTRAPPTCALRGIESRIFRVKDRHCKSSCSTVA